MRTTCASSTAASSCAARSTGETLRLLDGRDITLDDSVLVIADTSKALGLAGIMGGERTPGSADDDAMFCSRSHSSRPRRSPGAVARYGLVTDASQRFERGVDPTLQERAIERATQLLLRDRRRSGRAAQITELAAELPRARPVTLRPERARRVIGADIDDDAIAAILDGLGMQLTTSGRAAGTSYPPSVALRHRDRGRPHRGDRAHRTVSTAIPETVQPSRQRFGAAHRDTGRRERASRTLLVRRGYHEAITYSFVDPALQIAVHARWRDS